MSLTQRRETDPYRENHADVWNVTNWSIVRFPHEPRKDLFIPTAENCPIPLEYIDVTRATRMLGLDGEYTVEEDIWWPYETKITDGKLIGSTVFTLLQKPPKLGHEWVVGREVRRQRNTPRPPTMLPECWDSLTDEPVSYTHLTLPTICSV